MIRHSIQNTSDTSGLLFDIAVAKGRMDYESAHSVDKGVSDQRSIDTELVVSLTTHGHRIHTVYRTIESLFLQTVKPNRIVLYVNQQDYSSVSSLPLLLQRQMSRGLEVRFVEDLRSYTKLLYALQDFPEACIVTVDDDIIYPCDLIEHLSGMHRKFPGAVCSIVSQTLSLKDSRSFHPFSAFCYDHLDEDHQSVFYLPEGYAGVLYPPKSLSDHVVEKDVFLSLCPTADDIWFRAMSLLQGTPVVQSCMNHHILRRTFVDQSVQAGALQEINNRGRQNDVQLARVFDYYDLYSRLS